MPDVEWNKKVWDGGYDWSAGGDNWSSAWGSPEAQWTWSLRPRIERFLPTGTILEVGPGFGRWSQFLAGLCDRLVLVDLSEQCIAACRERFESQRHVQFHVNDGTSLDMVEDGTVDLAFSFDSLVHAEMDVLEGYLDQLQRKLSPDGVVVFHHSNLGSFRYFAFTRWLEDRLKPRGSIAETLSADDEQAERRPGLAKRFVKAMADVAMALRIVDRSHMRALSVSAPRFREAAESRGLSCVSQEIVRWGFSRRPIDCISVLTREGSKWATAGRVVVNKDFMREAKSVKSLAGLYGQQEVSVVD